MKYLVNIFKIFNKIIVYIKDINCYFQVNASFLSVMNLGIHYVYVEEFLDILLKVCPQEYEIIKNNSAIISEESYKKINSINEIKGGEFILCLHPTNKCNLSCRYCFRQFKDYSNHKLSYEVAKDAINYLIDEYAPNATKYIVDLSGSGEPLTNFELVKKIASFCDYKQNIIGKSVAVMFSTNAVDLSAEKKEYINNNLVVGVSLDGDQKTNDISRVDKNNNGTYSKVRDFLESNNRTFGVAVTITPVNQNVDEIYNHVYGLPNVDAISMRFVRMYDNSKYDFENFDVNELINHYELLCKNLIKNLKAKNYEYIKVLLRGNDFLGRYISKLMLQGYVNYFRCDAGKNRISIDYKGDIFACSVLQGYDEYKIGNIYSGLNEMKIKNFLEPNIFQSNVCKECWASFLCGGECYAVSYFKMKQFNNPYKKKCNLKKGLIKLSIGFVETIKDECPESFEYLLSFVTETWNYHVTDSAIWASIKILNYYGFKPTYIEISSIIKVKEYGVLPSAVLNYIKTYKKKVKAYRLNNIFDFCAIETPAISIINKVSLLSYQYVIINNLDDNYVYIETINDVKLHKVNKKTYLLDYSDIVIF